MPFSRCPSSVETNVSDLISEEGPQSQSPLHLRSWAANDSAQAAKTCSSPSSSDTNSPDVLQLRLQVATSQLNDRNAQIRGLEASVRELQAHAAAAAGRDEGCQLSQAMLVQRIQQLEAALASSQQAEQERAAQLARLESRAAVAEGSLAATEQQLGKGLSELQAGHAAALALQREEHSRELSAERQRNDAAAAAAKADWEARLQELAASKAAAEAAARREQQRVREMQAQLDKEGSKHEAVKELMRHSEALQCQVDRLQAAAQEERRRASKVAQAAEAAAQQERRQAHAAVEEVQLKTQEAAREQDKLVRQARAKQQRAETEVKSAKQAAAQLAGQVQQLEEQTAKKDLQLDAAVQQVSLMQHELEALRQGLSGQQAAALESARGEFAAALTSCHAELESTRVRLCEESLVAQRQGQALATILRILGVHAGEQVGGWAGAGGSSTAQGPGCTAAPEAANVGTERVPGVAPDPLKVVAFVEAVGGSMLDIQQQWELEKAETAAAQQAAAAANEQLQELLDRERQEGRGLAVDAAQMAVALQGMEDELEQARQQLHQLDAAKAARTAADAALEACRSELAAASARAATAGDNAVKWQGVAAATEARAGKLAAEAEAAGREAQAAREEVEAKAGRMEELRRAMAAAVADRSSSAQGLSCALASAQQAISTACQPALHHLQAAVAVLGAKGPESEPQVHALASMLQAVSGLLRDLPPAEADLAGCVGALSSAVAQMAAGYATVSSMTQERVKVHQVLSSVNSQMQAAAASHPSRSQAAGRSAAAGSALVGGSAAAAVGSASLSLIDLLQQLTQTVVGMVEGLAVEKECLESQMLHAAEESTQLRSQLQSMHAVLVSLQSHTSLEHREALFALEQARLQLSAVQQENEQLSQRAQQAQQAADASRASAAREWVAVRDDLSELVTQAEQAQLQADATNRRQQEEHEERLAAAERLVSESAAGRAVAESEADLLQRELAEAQQELAAAEQQLAAKEKSLRESLEASHADARQLEAKVEQLQKQLAARVRKGGISTAPAKKATAASSTAAAHKRDSERLRAQVEALQEQVRVLEAHVSRGVQQLRQARDISEAAQRTIADAEGRASRAETLLRKVDERKAAAEVERRRANEAASRLEQQVLELQSRLEAAQHRERSAQADAERLRAACSRQQADARQLGGALSQLEVAEAALRDSQGTAGRLLQDCTALQRENRRLDEEERQLTAQLQEAQAQAAAAGHQVEDLQGTLDSVITELEIARSLLDNQKHQELQRQLEGLDGQGGAHQRAADGSPALSQHQFQHQHQQHHHQLVAYPVRVESLRFVPKAGAGRQFVLDQAISSSVLGTRDTNAGSQSPGGRAAFKSGQLLTPGCDDLQAASTAEPGVEGLPSPVTQLWTLRTPGTPAAAAHLAGDAVMSRSASGGANRGHSVARFSSSDCAGAGAAAAAAADTVDIRRLVGAVESLQRQLAVKDHQLRAAQKQVAASRPSTAGGSRPGSASGGDGGDGSLVLQQKLKAAQQQVASLRALTDNLERQLGDAQQAQQAQQAVQAQLASIGRQLASLLLEEAGSGGAAVSSSSQPSTSGDAVGVLRLQAHQLEQLAGRLGEEVHHSRRTLAAAQQQGSTLTLQLASRNALVDALQAQLRTFAGQSGAGASHSDAQTEQLLQPPPLDSAAANSVDVGPGPAGAGSAEALGSLDRIVALWRQACAAKDDQLQQLRCERDQAQEALTCAQVELEALARTNEELAEQQQRSCSLAEELQQQLPQAEERLAAAQEEEQALAARCAELEALVRDLQELADAEGSAAIEARQGQAVAAQQIQNMEQQLQVATAKVRELQHGAQLDQLSRSDAESLRQQAAALKSELAATREQATAAQRQVAELQQRLHQQQDSAQAAANGSRSALGARLDAARRAEQQLLRQVQDMSAALAAAEAQGEEAAHAAASKTAEASQLQEQLSASEQQVKDALQTVEQQSGALSDLQAALSRQQRQQETTAAMQATQEQLARQLATTQQQLAAARQDAAAAQQQAEALRAQAAKAEAAAARAVAERRHLQAAEQSVQEAMQRYQQGIAVLSSTLRQLQESGPREVAGEDHVLASLQARSRNSGSSSRTASSSMPVGQLVDEILLQVHRRDCDIASLVAQVAHFEASLSSKARVAAETETQQYQQQRSLARLKEQLQGCTQEAAALKRQLSDREAELRQVRLQAARAGDGPRSSARRFSGMPGPAASVSSSSKHLTPL